MNGRQRHGKDVLGRMRRVHFVGIGGVGMSGVAEVLLNLGFPVSGSDCVDGAALRRLRALGAQVFVGHDAAHVASADVIVTSSAIGEDNPELVAARQARIPVVPRAEMLGELMRFRQGIAVAGTHGKTTTTSLLASILAEGGLDPTFVIGGQLNSAGSNARLGEGDWLVAEADESDGSFLQLQPLLAVVTNIDADHLVNFDNRFDHLQQAFLDFLHRLPFYGIAVVCSDSPAVANIMPKIARTVISYGFDEPADVQGRAFRQDGLTAHFEAHLPEVDAWLPISLPLPGLHNARNALGAMAMAWELGVPAAAIQNALSGFGGVSRRFVCYPEQRFTGGRISVVDDYGHHPTELAATIEAARAVYPGRRLVMAFQPHRYTRTRDLFEDFTQVLSTVDALVLTEVYPGGEPSIPGADGRALCRSVRSRGKLEPIFCGDLHQLGEVLCDVVKDDDVVLFSGAGDIGAMASELLADTAWLEGRT